MQLDNWIPDKMVQQLGGPKMDVRYKSSKKGPSLIFLIGCKSGGFLGAVCVMKSLESKS